MISLKAVTKTFRNGEGREVVALDAADLHVDKGEFVAVVGPSGSGKSTLLYAMGGLLQPTSGHVKIGDRSIYKLGASERAALRRQTIGFVFQTFNLVPYLTCLENVALPAMLDGKPTAVALAAAEAILARVGLRERLTHRPAALSVGERQRAGIARAVVNGPTVLLADEPTGNLDPANADGAMALLRELNRGGLTIVMVTHDPRLAIMTRRIVHLERGKLRRHASSEERRQTA